MSDLYNKVREDVPFRKMWGGKKRIRLRIALSCTECAAKGGSIGSRESCVTD